MKKKTSKKLRLSRETLRDLERSDSQRVAGGGDPSAMSWDEPCCETGFSPRPCPPDTA